MQQRHHIFLWMLLCSTMFLSKNTNAKPDKPVEKKEQPEIITVIEKARALLKTATVPTKKIGGGNAILAVWHNAASHHLHLVTVRNGQSLTKGSTTSLGLMNGVNSQYHVFCRKGKKAIVLAIKTNIFGPHRRGSRPVVYTPYSPDLDTQILQEHGLTYTETIIKKAEQELRKRKVVSRTDSEKLITENIPDDILLTLIVIEHIDPQDFIVNGSTTTMHRVFTTLALNGDETYRYAISRANARGIAQFTPRTYHDIRRKYPAAQLPKDFGKAMDDPVTSIIAMMCLLDDLLSRAPMPTNHKEVGPYLASAYNGGENRTKSAYLANPKHWSEHKKGLLPETVQYVHEYRLILNNLSTRDLK